MLVFFSALMVRSQENDWKLEKEIALSKESVWAVDEFNNVYIAANNTLTKTDSIGQLKFKQSIKSFGNLSAIEIINSMKIVVFSEEQQSIGFFDNTLTQSDNSIDLSELNIVNARIISRSSQQEKLWVLDQQNSTLFLISLNRSNQFQEISNLSGLLNLNDITFIKEEKNQLFVADKSGKICLFDVYGSLKNCFNFPRFDALTIKGDFIIGCQNDQIEFFNTKNLETKKLLFPIKGVKECKLSGNYFYFRTDNKIYKYTLNLYN
ncbi:MAG: hypothetical protein RIT10_1307 [Bacteroidota bacterium]